MADFDERKLRALAWLGSEEPDRSRKGGIDAPIAVLIDRVNAHPDFFTTSSCSGRITLFSEPCAQSGEELAAENGSGDGTRKKKKGGDWLFVSHELVTPQEIVSATHKFVSNAQHELLVFRFEPFILALDCASVAAAQDLVACAIASGFRESGITSIRKRIIVAIRCSIRLEVPVAEKGKLLVSEEYLSYLTSTANSKLEQNKRRTNRFLDSFITQFQSGALSSLDTPIQVTNDDHFKAEIVEDDHSDSQEFHDLCGSESSLLLSSVRQSVSDSGQTFKDPDLHDGVCRIGKSSNEDSMQAKRMSGWFDESTAGLCLKASELRLSESAAELFRRWGHSACNVGSRLVIFGGYGGSGRHARLNDLLVLTVPDQELKRLELKTELSPRMAHTASVINDDIWIIGGRRGPHDLLADVLVIKCEEADVFSPTITGDTFIPRHRHAAAAVRDKIYIFGGLGEEGVLADLYILDAARFTWSRLDCKGATPPARHSHSLCAIDDKLYLYGGFDGKEILGDLHVLDTRGLEWSKVLTTGELPVPRFSHSCIVLGDCLAVLGGCPTMKQANSLFVLDPRAMVWKRVGLSVPGDCLLVRHTATVVEGLLFVVGGGASCYAFGTMFSVSFVV
ncbi:hypothetical protein SELMODRAFT_418563 [Selaginella moellendorffii]|uniref:tRNA(Phe) 7-[(3-amino-3-carboxypropyl)-4-demethylwyosine(37)-N(4)]-methyltransferase n=1 Tax=Selaginella moellendorffii TaxID=88036 RepID=D8S640_SELML|nr:tRNA wybutosine-synthesizing protein 2/3/4 isoform X1 [Selaginella moellendorffii]EFJ20280.1 hypothetical protein SELMODRAFT_418563 [Selaginella moellendorffii]|eukprot:XP_002978833.1 tRNA wybutosine-synthesizing protein 2/3/4 isoform X1 [Selaginella moellendorffii]